MKSLMRMLGILGFVLVASQGRLFAQDSLNTAKDLYASAAYEDALSTLTRLNMAGAAAPDARQIAEYRAFCLYALGRTGEAESVAESIIRKEPMTGLDAADLSPRLETMFSDVRKRLLPSLIRERFRTARAALDQKDPSVAEPQLVEAHLMIADAEKLGVKDDGLADLSELVDGFLQLVRSTANQTTSAEPPAVPSGAAGIPSGPRQPAGPAPAAGAANGPNVYSDGDEAVKPPTALNQVMPTMPSDLMTVLRATNKTAILTVVIDEKGDVVDATMRKSLNPMFDNLLLGAARHWKYRPATKDGVAVPYLKTLIVTP